MSDKTIKELAEELNVSKQAIRKHLNKLPPTLSVTKKQGVIYLNKGVVSFITKRIKKVTSNDTGNQEEKVTTDKIILNDYISELKEQLKQKDQQLAQAHKIIENQQILTLQAKKKLNSSNISRKKKSKPFLNQHVKKKQIGFQNCSNKKRPHPKNKLALCTLIQSLLNSLFLTHSLCSFVQHDLHD